MSKKTILLAYIFSILATLFGSTGPNIFMGLSEGIRKVGIMYFLFIGSFVLLSISIVRTRGIGNVSVLFLDKKIFALFLLAGIANGLLFTFYVLAMETKTITETVLIIRIGPLFVLLLSVLILKETIKNYLTLFLAVFLCLLGMIAIEVDKGFSFVNLLNYFVLFSLLAAFFQAVYMTLTRLIQTEINAPKDFIVGVIMLVAALVLLAYYFIFTDYSFLIPDVGSLGLILWLGIGTVGLPAILNLKSYELADNFGRFAMVSYLNPILA